MYKVGDYVTFHDSMLIKQMSEEDCNGDHPFEHCDITPDMLEMLDGWDDNQIVSIDEDGDFKFEDFPYTWPIEVIKGLADDQRKEKFECYECGCSFMVDDRDDFDCPNCMEE